MVYTILFRFENISLCVRYHLIELELLDSYKTSTINYLKKILHPPAEGTDGIGAKSNPPQSWSNLPTSETEMAAAG